MFVGSKSQSQAEAVTFRVSEDWPTALLYAVQLVLMKRCPGKCEKTKADREAVAPEDHRPGGSR